MNLFLGLLIMLFCVNQISCELCDRIKTCGECIGSSPHCVWCSAENHTGTRCKASSLIVKNISWCNLTPYDPQLKYEIKNEKEGLATVQFKPHSINIRARPGITVPFNMSYKPAQDYPLDIYYLMDNSYTMEVHKQTLTEQASNISKALYELTNNVRFGVGSFVEKCALPYARPSIHKAYAFSNHLSLTDMKDTKDMEKFTNVIKKISSGANYDNPESGLDALMQTMVCKEINWRDDARKIIILSTDETYHSAGDGKIVGAAQPNDMKCHLNETGTYDRSSLIYDYPSVSQINKIAGKEKIRIIFAVLEEVKDVYVALAEKVQGAKYVQLSNGTGVVNMIKNEYLNLVRNLEISHDPVLPHYIDLKLDPPCSKKKLCEVKHEQSVNINASLTVNHCPKDLKYSHLLEISPVGLHEKLVIKIEIDCQCQCEKDETVEINSSKCSGNGSYQCGVCKCNPNRYNGSCECAGTSTNEIDLDKCRAHKNDTKVCSGRGTCKCGECKCREDYNGPFCQFGVYECATPSGGEVCAGNGYCVNNTCQCVDGWTGSDCTCTLDHTTCVGRHSMTCSGNGICECGKCVCTKLDTNNKIYSGELCDYCDNCDEMYCKELEDYAECNYVSDKTTCDNKFKNTSSYVVHKGNKTTMNSREWKPIYLCRKILNDGSAILFKHKNKGDYMSILIQEEKEIPPTANIWVPVGSAMGVILLVGLLTVIGWKILVDMHDAEEYRKFAEESTAAGFEVTTNPLYRSPVHIYNPAYTGNC